VSIAAEPNIIEHDSREAWLAARTSGIGASEIAAAIGQSPYQSMFALWSEKVTGERQEIDSEAAEWGVELEPLIIKKFGERTGRKVAPWNQLHTVVSPAHDWLRCTPDAIQIDDERGPGTLQVKTTSLRLESNWKDDPPIHVQIQAQFEAWMLGFEYGTVCALIGGQRLVWHDFTVNKRFIAVTLKKLAEFWELVQSGNPPEVDGSDSTTAAIKRMYPVDEGGEIDLGAEHEKLVAKKLSLGQRKQRIEKTLAEVDNRLRVALGDYTAGVLPSGVKVTNKSQTRPETVMKASTFRVLRISTKGK
jgi:putative phage-type endonuclease